jgi:hypothetical protein
MVTLRLMRGILRVICATALSALPSLNCLIGQCWLVDWSIGADGVNWAQIAALQMSICHPNHNLGRATVSCQVS